MRYTRVLAILFLLFSLFNTVASPLTTVKAADDDCRTFTETTHKICGRFLQYWESHGQLAQQGLPISDVFMEVNAPPPAGDGNVHKVQYFERARFEYHEENQPPYDVLLGLLGTEQFTAKYQGVTPIDKEVQPPLGTCQLFDETQLDVCANFLTYWKNHGQLAQEGLPVSDYFGETNAPPPAGDGKDHVVQYFERARFEYHYENEGTQYEILLGLLGTEQFAKKYPNGEPPIVAYPLPLN